MGILSKFNLISEKLHDDVGKLPDWAQVNDVANQFEGSDYVEKFMYTIPPVRTSSLGTAQYYPFLDASVSIGSSGTCISWGQPFVNSYRYDDEEEVTACKFCGVVQETKDKCVYCGAPRGKKMTDLSKFLGWTVVDTSEDCIILTDGESAFVVVISEVDKVD